MERRKQEELREEANAIVNFSKQFDLKVRTSGLASLKYILGSPDYIGSYVLILYSSQVVSIV